MSCQSAPGLRCELVITNATSSVLPYQCPSMQLISAHQCSLINAH
ncbi:unnamed protein product, partial [Staurois parvus]